MIIKIMACIALVVLFFLLSKSADLIVHNIKILGKKLGIRIFVLGIILGIMTSLPEIAIGINTTINNISEISFGNLMGGIIVLFGLILAISAILNRRIETEENSWPFLSILGFLILPLILGLKGEINGFDGVFLMICYLILISFLYRKNKKEKHLNIGVINRENVSKDILYIIAGMIGLIIFSELIIKTTMIVLDGYSISPLIIGLLVYSVGTNLPELSIAIRSFKKKVSELSFSNLMGSAMGNVLTLGFISLIKPISIEVDSSYYFLIIMSLVLFSLLYIFYRTGRVLSRVEGFALLAIYVIFVIGQILIQLN